jgi:hypothetical protein
LGFIVAYNWASVLQSAFYFPIAMLVVTQTIPMPYGNMISILAVGLMMVYVWFVTQVVLDVPAAIAIAVVGFDIILSIVIRATSESMMRVESVMLNV